MVLKMAKYRDVAPLKLIGKEDEQKCERSRYQSYRFLGLSSSLIPLDQRPCLSLFQNCFLLLFYFILFFFFTASLAGL